MSKEMIIGISVVFGFKFTVLLLGYLFRSRKEDV
jgi:hypothetical protein